MTVRLNNALVIILVLLTSAGPVGAEGNSDRRAQALAFNCFTCHGTDGRSPGSIKSLSSLSADEIRDKLLAFKRGENDPTIMNRIAGGYSDAEISIIADYIASLD